MSKRPLISLLLLAFVAGCGGDGEAGALERSAAYKHGPPPGPAPYPYLLTSYGGPGDACSGTPACGGKSVDGTWYYSTGAYTFGCGSKLQLEANGKCVVVEVVDNGPAAWVEQNAKAKCGGTGYIIDASPLAAKHLFGTSSAGWSDCFAIKVTEVPASSPSGPATCSGGGTTPPPPPPPPTPYCGDGKLDAGEKCDIGIPDGQPGSCPTPYDCNDGNSCTADTLIGSGCQVSCAHANTCPPPPSCGDGKLDAGEKCDPGIPAGAWGSCTIGCDDGDDCTADVLSGSGCQVSCAHTEICEPPPPPAPPAPPVCGNGKVDAGEWCDAAIPAGQPGTCPTACDDGNPCTADTLMGSGCLAMCANVPVACGGGGGGAGAPVAGAPVGAPCGKNADCASGQCAVAALGYPGGMCTRTCSDRCETEPGVPAPLCISTGVAYATQYLVGGGEGQCTPLCDFASHATGCRAGYACATRSSVTGGAERAVCLPIGAGDSQTTPAPAGPNNTLPAADGAVMGGCVAAPSTPAPASFLSLILLAAVALLRTRREQR